MQLRAQAEAAGSIQMPDDASPGTAGFRLLNDYQRGFPLVAQPFVAIARDIGMDEQAVLGAYRGWQQSGVVSRIGAVFAPRRVGASTLAALAAPADRLEEIAARVSAVAEVNHNYQREHAFNLWFVVTASSSQRLAQIVAEIERDTGCGVIVLPLEEEFHIDLGFCLAGGARVAPAAPRTTDADFGDIACAMPGMERSLMTAVQAGLSLESRPFEALGRAIGVTEGMVIELLEGWLNEGIVKRFGVVVRHHELGFRANAMCVWDVPDHAVHALGCRLAAEPAVTLCYRRRRALPAWPYSLYCMIHGKSRDEVERTRDAIAARLGLDRWAHEVLFSTRRFKQRGARYWPEDDTEDGDA
jgi:DNA-binding Lrp family transcriptional regulator